MLKNEIKWVLCKEKLPENKDEYLVLIKQKYEYEKDWEYNIDIAINYGTYIDNYWDTFIDWIEGQETHIIAWAKLPSPIDLVEKIEE